MLKYKIKIQDNTVYIDVEWIHKWETKYLWINTKQKEVVQLFKRIEDTYNN